MVFNSMDFLLFFPIVIIVYFVFPVRIRYIWLLLSSYYFYMCWNPKYIILILFSTIVTYVTGRVIELIKRSQNSDLIKRYLLNCCIAISCMLNLAMLFYFKYLGFAIFSINRVISIVNLHISVTIPDVILPVGISFYTFQVLGYIVDVYRDEIKAEKNFLKYALFVSFFPQLVAGPIERSKNLLYQVNKPRRFEIESIRQGLLTMSYGLYMKVVVADQLSSIIDPIYNDWIERQGMELMIATILFAFQIYCDFEGYSQMAIGSAQILGFRINQNFRTPYLSTSIQDFWKRWHISLTSWFRDYLYIPLGGNRKGKLKKYINTIIIFLVSGLWHGASWHFVIWGGINGIYIVLQDLTKTLRSRLYTLLKIDTETFLWKCFKGFIVFILIDISWLFFRAEGIMQSINILKTIYYDFNLWYLFSDDFYNIFGSAKTFSIIIVSLLIVFIIDILHRRGIDLKRYILRQQIIYRWGIYFTIIIGIMFLGAYGSDYEQIQFIYFQF